MINKCMIKKIKQIKFSIFLFDFFNFILIYFFFRGSETFYEGNQSKRN